jgi:hypothetical protein
MNDELRQYTNTTLILPRWLNVWHPNQRPITRALAFFELRFIILFSV